MKKTYAKLKELAIALMAALGTVYGVVPGAKFAKAESAGSHRLHFRPILCRGAVAVMTAVVLVLTGVVPEGINLPGTKGIPPIVEAADGPSKGKITFYKYTRYNEPKDFPQSGWKDVIIFNKDGGNYYFMNNLEDCTDGHWLATNTNIDTYINPDAESFISRYKWSNYSIKKCSTTGVGWQIRGYSDKYSEYGYVSCVTPGGKSPFFTAWSGMHTDWIFSYYNNKGWFGADSLTINNNLTHCCYWKGHQGQGVWYGFGSNISGDCMSWRVFEISEVTYNCINKDYSIGTEKNPQTYIATGGNGGLFLQEGVTLTIPQGSVLVVKDGSFFVNGTINCYGTILVEDGGSLTTYASTSSGANINLYDGGAMIVRSGGRVYAGCPEGSLGAKEDGSMNVYPGAYIINYGLLVAGRCDFEWDSGSAIVENHKGATMYLGYAVEDGSKFLSTAYSDASATALGLVKTNGALYLQTGNTQTVFKVWDGAKTGFGNNIHTRSLKLYSYDKDGKCTTKNYTP